MDASITGIVHRPSPGRLSLVLAMQNQGRKLRPKIKAETAGTVVSFWKPGVGPQFSLREIEAEKTEMLKAERLKDEG